MYPQTEYPYERLLAENRARGRLDPEFELIDTAIFDDSRYWEITADYAKASPEELLIRVSVRNAGPQEATIEVLPTLWCRNRWSWEPGAPAPSIALDGGLLVAEHPDLGRRFLSPAGTPEALFCEHETNTERLFGVPGATPYPKDGIGDYVIHGAPTVNPDRRGTKAALRYRLEVPAGSRILPWRDGRRSRRLAPDGLDRARRGSDRPPRPRLTRARRMRR